MTYRRAIQLVTTGPGIVVGDLEDDFHRFRVTLRHDSSRVTEVTGEALRSPWTTCPDASGPLHTLEGMELSTRIAAPGEVTDARMNCTHMFDLAGLSVVHAAAGRHARRYDAELPTRSGATQVATLRRDGEPHLRWTLAPGPDGHQTCIDPRPFSEAPWQCGFLRWASTELDPDTAEAATVLRRACYIGIGDGMDLDRYDHPSEIEYQMSGVCYTMQPERISVAIRNRGTIRDFSDEPDALLTDLPDPAG